MQLDRKKLLAIAGRVEPRSEQPTQRPTPPDAPKITTTAAAIVDAGRRRRGEIGEPMKTSTVAAAVIAAGQWRRGEIDATPRPTGLALQIVNAGRKRRGQEPL